MKLCTSSPKFKDLIEIILNDDNKKFLEKKPKNLSGQIDKMPFFNFLLSSNSFKIMKIIIKNQQLTDTSDINLTTLKLLLSNKYLSISEKTYIYTKIIKRHIMVPEKRLFKLILKDDVKCLFWLNRSKSLKIKDYENLFLEEINEYNVEFCRHKKIELIPLLLKVNKYNIINFEDYTEFLDEDEIILLINSSLKHMKNKDLDINLLDSIIKILINNQNLISKVDIQLLSLQTSLEDNIFSFLNIDIEKILLFKKFSQTKQKFKVQKI